MVQSTAPTVDEYLAGLPEDRRAVVKSMRDLIRKNLPKGYEESMGHGMICYGIPLERYPDTYNGQPLCYVALAAQKNAYSLYLMGPYGDPKLTEQLRKAFAEAGKKLDMGKSCVRFKKPEALELDAIAKAIAAVPPDQFIRQYESARSGVRRP